MGYTNRTYAELFAYVKALAGVDSFASSEETKILELINSRLKVAFDYSPTWPRYLIGAQARPANDGLIAFDYSAAGGIRTGSAESRSGDTVTIVCTAAVDFVPGMQVTIAGLTGSVDPNGTYPVASISTTTATNDTFTYQLDTTNTATETYTGTATVTPVAVPDIADFIRIWNGNPMSRAGAYDMNFWVDSDGARLTGDHDGLAGYYVAFKKEWPGPYTTSSTDIPQEFYQYAARAAYADFLRMDGQTDKAIAEEANALQYLLLEADKAAQQANNNRVFGRISTYLNSRTLI